MVDCGHHNWSKEKQNPNNTEEQQQNRRKPTRTMKQRPKNEPVNPTEPQIVVHVGLAKFGLAEVGFGSLVKVRVAKSRFTVGWAKFGCLRMAKGGPPSPSHPPPHTFSPLPPSPLPSSITLRSPRHTPETLQHEITVFEGEWGGWDGRAVEWV